MNITDSAILNNLFIPGITLPDNAFEKKYIECRTKEKRMYSDEELSKLPECIPSHPHYIEWQIRKASAARMYEYLANKKRPLHILEIGCGNGWMLHYLSGISRSRLTGMDINFTELQQAARVFSDDAKVKFIYGDIRSGILGEKKYDIILFAASLQYFKSLDEILERSLQHLQHDGEIHITDTKFYAPAEVNAAKERSKNHFYNLGFPEMGNYYFHHSLCSLAPFNHKVLYEPQSMFNRVLRNKIPFHWVRIKNDGAKSYQPGPYNTRFNVTAAFKRIRSALYRSLY